MLVLGTSYGTSWADETSYDDTLQKFRGAGASSGYFSQAYGYAVFPNIGKVGLIIGAAGGSGRVYQQGTYIGDTTMNQLSAGFQIGAQVYSQVIFFEDARALEDFTSGNFEFGAKAGAVAITAGASAGAGTTGSSATASGGEHNAITAGSRYTKGMAVFTIARGGLMFEAALEGQKFSYTPRPMGDS
jgi:lipid-binding SYLF domain-containing protein